MTQMNADWDSPVLGRRGAALLVPRQIAVLFFGQVLRGFHPVTWEVGRCGHLTVDRTRRNARDDSGRCV